MFILRGAPLSPDVAFVDVNDIQRPANWLRLASPQEREAAGVTEVPDPPAPPDQRFYWGWDQNGKAIPKNHADLVEQWVAQTKATANSLLTPTDWVIIREADNGKVADPAIRTRRETIRLLAGSKAFEIRATQSTDELAAYVTSAAYSSWETPAPIDSSGTSDAQMTSDAGFVSSGVGQVTAQF